MGPLTGLDAVEKKTFLAPPGNSLIHFVCAGNAVSARPIAQAALLPTCCVACNLLRPDITEMTGIPVSGRIGPTPALRGY